MKKSVRAGLAIGAGILLLAAAEAPIRDIARGSPAEDGAIDNPAVSTEPASSLIRIEGPATPLPAAPAASERVILKDLDTEAELDFPAQAPVAAALPRARTLAEAVDRHRGRDASDLDVQGRCLAKAIFWESRGEPLSGQLAVAQVILNRVESRRFGNDICSVVKAPRQFSFVRGGSIPDASNRSQWGTAQAVAHVALEGDWNDVVGSATHFHATRVNPAWRLTRVATIGNHIFYR
ncbi:MAG: cell wall hydrolase [Thermaurantiacus sp.]